MKRILTTTLAAALLFASVCTATTRYVATNGSDSNTCGTSSRCSTINRAYQLSVAGDTILMATGTYSATQLIVSNGMAAGTASLTPVTANLVTVKPEGSAQSVNITGDLLFGSSTSDNPVLHMSFEDIHIASWWNIRSARDVHFVRVRVTDLSQWNCADYVSVQSSEYDTIVTDFGDGIDLYGAAYGTTCHASITHIGNWLIEDSTIHGTSTNQATAHPDAIALDDGDKVTIRRNKFWNNCGDNLRMAVGLNGVTGAVIENNYFAPEVSCAAGAATNLQIVGIGAIVRYNTIDGFVQTVTSNYLAWAANQVWEGNIITIGPQDGCPAGSGTVARYNVWGASNDAGCGTNNVRVSSFSGWFTDTAAGDYSLTSGALAAVGAGNPNSYPAVDILGYPRPSGDTPDAGAFEYGASSGTGAPAITTALTLPAGTLGSAYAAQFLATGTAPITWTATGVPSGLTLSTTGLLSGTPTAAATSTIAVTATNDADSDGPTNFSLTVNAVVPTVTTTAASVITASGASTGGNVTATGGANVTERGLCYGRSTSPAVSGGTCLTNGTGTGTFAVTLSGLIAAATYHIQAYALNSAGYGYGSDATFATAGTAPAITTASPLTVGTATVAYSRQLAATGTTPITWTATGVPAGLTLSSSGLLSGTPTGAATSTIAVTATNAIGTGTKSFSLTVQAAVSTLTASCNAPPQGTVGTAYAVTFVGNGGTAPYTFAISAGALPTSVTLNTSTGAVTGTPTVAGTFTPTVQVTDSAGSPATATAACSMVIIPTPPSSGLTVSCGSAPTGVVKSPYSYAFPKSGGTAPYTSAIAGGSLPSGLHLTSSTVTVSGTPKSNGTYAFSLRVTDAAAATVTCGASITIGNPDSPTPVAIPQTTLTQAVTTTDTALPLASLSGLLPFASVLSTQTFGAYTDHEYMTMTVPPTLQDIQAVGYTVYLRVFRGANGTARAHVAGKNVWYGPASYFYNKAPHGSCSTTTAPVLPYIDITHGAVYDCTNGAWVARVSQ